MSASDLESKNDLDSEVPTIEKTADLEAEKNVSGLSNEHDDACFTSNEAYVEDIIQDNSNDVANDDCDEPEQHIIDTIDGKSNECQNEIQKHRNTSELDENQLACIKQELGSIDKKIDSISSNLGRFLSELKRKDDLIFEMHEEIKSYKSGLHLQMVMPILQEIISVIDSIESKVTLYENKPENDPEKIIKSLKNVKIDLLDILSHYEIEPYSSDDESQFDPAKQKSIKTATTEIEIQHRKISRHINSGYQRRDNKIRPELVEVFVYKKPDNNLS